MIYGEGKKINFDILAKHPSFDYEGAEMYKHLSDIVDFKELAKDIIKFLKSEPDPKQKWQEWNNIVRSLFEAMGIMAKFSKEELRSQWLLEDLVQLSLEFMVKRSLNLSPISP